MPGFDRTGPLGQGPRTGRGMGYCAGGTNVNYGYGVGRGGIPWGGGRGRAWGGGFGRGRGFGGRGWVGYGAPVAAGPVVQPYTAANEREYLSGMIADLQVELENAKKRLDEIEKEES